MYIVCEWSVIVRVSQRKLPDHHKMNFSLGKYVTGGKERKNSKSMYVHYKKGLQDENLLHLYYVVIQRHSKAVL